MKFVVGEEPAGDYIIRNSPAFNPPSCFRKRTVLVFTL